MLNHNHRKLERQVEVPVSGHTGRSATLDKIKGTYHPKKSSLSNSMKMRRQLQKVSRFINCEKIGKNVKAKSALGRCGLFCNRDGEIRVGSAGLTWSGFETCRSALCPYCGTIKAKGYREEMKQSVGRMYERGGSVLFFTATNSRGGYELGDLYSLQSKILSRMLQGSFKSKLEEMFEYKGVYRRPEVQIRTKHKGDGQGDFHAHNHCLLFFGRKLTQEELQLLDKLLFSRWQKGIEKQGLTAYREFTRVEQPKNIEAMGSYITKLAGSLSLELSSVDTKDGKDSVSYFQLLKMIWAGDKSARTIALAKTYQEEMKGKRFMSVSRNLRRELLPELFSPDGVEMTEEEVEKFFEDAEREREEKEAKVIVPVVPQIVGYVASRDKLKEKLLHIMEHNNSFLYKFRDLCARICLLVADSKDDRCMEEFDLEDEVRRELHNLIDCWGTVP